MPVKNVCVTPVIPSTPLLRSISTTEVEVPVDNKNQHMEDPDSTSQKSPTPTAESPDLDRCTSQMSTSSSVQDICRICHCEQESHRPLITPCVCSGSMKYIHQDCLRQWIKCSDTKRCELCHYDFKMTSKVQPFRKWRKMAMTSNERRKILCSVSFHIIAITCVVWSLYVLIDRTADEIEKNVLEWPFWTKLIVVAIGFTGGLVFMYVQCKMYIHLCKRWQSYNKIIEIENCPPGPPGGSTKVKEITPPPTPVVIPLHDV